MSNFQNKLYNNIINTFYQIILLNYLIFEIKFLYLIKY